MSSELLRIHDENNNCDLVAVANPMGNFHMSTYAEMQDGTQKPVDGWYLFSKMIEKLGQGGGDANSCLIVNIAEGAADKTFSEIMEAWPNVKIIYDRHVFEPNGRYGNSLVDFCRCGSSSTQERGEPTISFERIEVDSSNVFKLYSSDYDCSESNIQFNDQNRKISG